MGYINSMKTEDHKMLGRYLADRWLRGAAPRGRAAFLFGCIWPDRNWLSYVRGSLSKRFLHGHHYENAKGYVDRMVKKLYRRLRFRLSLRVIDYFRLGVMVHYLADMFTYAHHSWFDGTMRAHSAYESRLHQCLLQVRERLPEWLSEAFQRPYGSISWSRLHAVYEQEPPSPWNDLAYIILATGSSVRRCSLAARFRGSERKRA